MNRLHFLKEMKRGLLETVKSVYEPIVADDLEKLERAADKALGLKWVYLTNEASLSNYVEQKFIEGKPIIICNEGVDVRAYSGICPACSNLLVLSTLYSTGKCLYCEKEYHFKEKSGDLRLTSYPTKKMTDDYYIGLASRF